MARTPSTRPRRRHRTLVQAIAAGAAVMLVAAVAGWALHVRPADNPTRSALAATSPAPSTAAPNPEAKQLLDEINQLTAAPRRFIPQEDQNRIASLMVQYAQLTGRGVPWAGGR